MRILVDADGCPVVAQTIAIGKMQEIEVILFCDTTHVFDAVGVKVITVSKGNDAVDFKIVNEVHKGDIIVTQDYGLAAMGLARGGCPIHQNGLVYTNENIEQLLFMRHVGKEARRKGVRTKGPSKRTKAQDDHYIKALQLLIEQLRKEELEVK